jgi:hypothetical protein
MWRNACGVQARDGKLSQRGQVIGTAEGRWTRVNVDKEAGLRLSQIRVAEFGGWHG